jgi:2-hydroxy-3-keto-5-methylthiopentenyl-1-phosphate phosphatase
LQSWTVLCDFDGTIALEDVTDSLLLRFGRPGWDVLEVDWREGRIGSRVCMQWQVALLDCHRDELMDHIASIRIDDRFPSFVAALEERGWPLVVVSDGLDMVIAAILQRHGLGRLTVVANRLQSVGPRSWQLDFPNARPGCIGASGTCKCAWSQPPAVAPASRVLMIGDGASDFCVAGRADMTFARKRLLEHCLDNGLRHLPVADFGQALALLPELATLAPAARGLPSL